MAELAYAHALGACSRKGLRVQISPSAPKQYKFVHHINLQDLIVYFNSHYNVHVILYYLARYGYGFIFLGTVFEGELILLASGFLAYLGALNIWLVIISGFVGAVVGDNIWYYIGRHGGTHFIDNYGKFFLLTKKRVSKAQKYFDTHGAKTIFFSRFIFGTRISSAVLAGALGMSRKKFLRSNVAGAGLWACLTVGLGYFFGNSFELLRHYIHQTEVALLILAIIVIIIFILRYIHNRYNA